MIIVLERDFMKKGLPRKSVRKMLGPPERIETSQDFYSIGAGYGPDFQQYVIEYDSIDTVINFYILDG